MRDINKIREDEKHHVETNKEIEKSRDGTFAILRHGGVLLRYGVKSKIIDDKTEAAAFIDKVRDKGAGYIKKVISTYFA